MNATGLPHTSTVRRLEPFLVALLAGGLAIVGGYLASRQAFQGERQLREDQRAADARAAARVLDLELFNRLRLTLNAFGIAHLPATSSSSPCRRNGPASSIRWRAS